MNCIVYNKNGEILRAVSCPSTSRHSQAKKGEFMMEGIADDATQKVEFDGFDVDGQPINPRIVDKTPEEIETDNPPPLEIPKGQRPAIITNEQLQNVMKRLDNLEKKQ